MTFDEYIAQAEAAAFSGWDFSYLEGRYDQQQPPWDYRELVIARIAESKALLDMGTGGGEFLGRLPYLPPQTFATEGYAPNLAIARAALAPRGVEVREVRDDDALPFADGQFDLIINRHESYSPTEVYRLLQPGGWFVTQQVGGKDNLELNQWLEDTPSFPYIDVGLHNDVAKLAAAGFALIDQQEARPITRFLDIGAVVYYLKAISWQIPEFNVDAYRERLLTLYQHIVTEGEFVTHSHRFLIVTRKPALSKPL